MPATQDNECRMRVIVPAHRAESTIDACLSALLAAGFETDSILVVDDGSPDRTGEKAHAHGVRVKRHETPQRPAAARNSGAAEVVDADVLVFVDSDVVVHPGLRDRLLAHFGDAELSAVIGSYDDRPGGSLVSRYRNLLHHMTHQQAAGPITTFWSGLGAMRRSAFDGAGGFDPAWEDIEDVELGLRVTEAGGRIRLDPDMQGTHLKEWTVRSMVRTDLWGRAVPWTRLIREGRLGSRELNASLAHRLSALSVLAVLAALPVALLDARALWPATAAVIAFVVLNLPLLRLMARTGGSRLALASLPFHALHYLAAVTGYAKVRLFEPAPSHRTRNLAPAAGEMPPR